MGRPILMQRDVAMSRFGVRGLGGASRQHRDQMRAIFGAAVQVAVQSLGGHGQAVEHLDRKSTRLNSSHHVISYAVFCLKKKTRTSRTSASSACAASATTCAISSATS